MSNILTRRLQFIAQRTHTLDSDEPITDIVLLEKPIPVSAKLTTIYDGDGRYHPLLWDRFSNEERKIWPTLSILEKQRIVRKTATRVKRLEESKETARETAAREQRAKLRREYRERNKKDPSFLEKNRLRAKTAWNNATDEKRELNKQRAKEARLRAKLRKQNQTGMSNTQWISHEGAVT